MISLEHGNQSHHLHHHDHEEGSSTGILELASILKGSSSRSPIEVTSLGLLIEHNYSLLSSSTNGSSADDTTPVLTPVLTSVLIPVVMEQSVIEQQDTFSNDTHDTHDTNHTNDIPNESINQSRTRSRSKRERKVPAKFMSQDLVIEDELIIKSISSVVSKDDLFGMETCNHKEEQSLDSDSSEEEDTSEDEQEKYKEYCLCRKPHANRFMIACDSCEEWFHGSCVGVTRKQSESYDSWICIPCQEKNPSLKCVLKPGVSLEGKRPSTSSQQSEEKIKSPTKHVKTKSSHDKFKKGDRHPDLIKQELTTEEVEEQKKLKEMIEKRKKEMQEKEKKREKKMGPIDPTMNQLFQVSDALRLPGGNTTEENKKDVLIKCLICQNDRVKTDKSIYCSLDCIKNHVRSVRKKRFESKNQDSHGFSVFDAFDLKDNEGTSSIRKKPDVTAKELIHFLIRNPGFTLDSLIKVRSSRKSVDGSGVDSRKSSISESSSTPRTPSTPVGQPFKERKRHPSGTETKLERRDSKTCGTKGLSNRNEDVRQKGVREKAEKAFHDALSSRIEASLDLGPNDRQRRRGILASGLAKDIERNLFDMFLTEGKHLLTDVGLKNYLSKYRTLLFNLKDNKNDKLFDSIFSTDPAQHITPHDLVRMTSEELARGSELDVWRKEEAKKSLINSVIINDEATDGPKLKKTRKGEEEIDTLDAKMTTPTSAEIGFNPLEQILKDIKASSSKPKQEVVDDVPRSPPRTVTAQQGSSDENKKRRPSDADDKSFPKRIKSQRSCSISTVTPDDDSTSTTSSSSNMAAKNKSEVRRVTVAPELPSILNSLPSLTGILLDSGNNLPLTSSKIIWQGFCSGFQESSSSTLNPAMTSGSRFPLVCRLPSDDQDESEMLTKFSSLPTSLNIVGRIAPDLVSGYIKDVLRSEQEMGIESSESLVEIIPLKLQRPHVEDQLDYDSDDEALEEDDELLLFHENYKKFISYLTQRKRYAVVDVKPLKKSTNIKDAYLFPLESGSTQLSTPILTKLCSESPLMKQLNSSPTKKPSTILGLILVRKASPGKSFERPRSSSTSTSDKPVTSTGVRRQSSSQDTRPSSVKVAVTLANRPVPTVVTYTPTPTTRLVSTPSTVFSPTNAAEEAEYDPESYIPGLSPVREDKDERFSSREERELMEKAQIQMKLIQDSLK